MIISILTTTYGSIALEDLNVREMVRNHRLAKSIADVSFSEIRRQIEYKAKYNGINLVFADRFYPSSKTCSVCGNIKKDLKLSDRVFRCPHCGIVMDRDYNASLNLLSLIPNNKVGTDYPEFTPADLTALQSRFILNGIVTSKVETGKQHKF